MKNLQEVMKTYEKFHFNNLILLTCYIITIIEVNNHKTLNLRPAQPNYL